EPRSVPTEVDAGVLVFEGDEGSHANAGEDLEEWEMGLEGEDPIVGPRPGPFAGAELEGVLDVDAEEGETRVAIGEEGRAFEAPGLEAEVAKGRSSEAELFRLPLEEETHRGKGEGGGGRSQAQSEHARPQKTPSPP